MEVSRSVHKVCLFQLNESTILENYRYWRVWWEALKSTFSFHHKKVERNFLENIFASLRSNALETLHDTFLKNFELSSKIWAEFIINSGTKLLNWFKFKLFIHPSVHSSNFYQSLRTKAIDPLETSTLTHIEPFLSSSVNPPRHASPESSRAAKPREISKSVSSGHRTAVNCNFRKQLPREPPENIAARNFHPSARVLSH